MEQGRRQIKAAPKNPSSLKLRRDKVDTKKIRHRAKSTAAKRLPHACPASSRTKGVLPDNVVLKLRYLQSADVSWSKVAVKSRRHRRSGLMSSTEGESADLTRDCPLDAAAHNPRTTRNIHKKNPPSGGKRETTSRLLRVQRNERRKLQSR